MPNFRALDRNNAARPNQIKLQGDTLRDQTRCTHAALPYLESYDTSLVKFFEGA